MLWDDQFDINATFFVFFFSLNNFNPNMWQNHTQSKKDKKKRIAMQAGSVKQMLLFYFNNYHWASCILSVLLLKL